MTLKELWLLAPQAFVFIVERDEDFNKISSLEYTGPYGITKEYGGRRVTRLLPTSYPMYKHVLEVELEK